MLASCFVSAIAAAASDPLTVYAGCEATYNAPDGEVYRSTDRGLSWRRASSNLPFGLRILKLVVDPTDARRVFLLSGVDLFAPKASRALYGSTDGGVTWSRMGAGLGAIADMDLDSRAPRVLYVTVLQPGAGSGSGYVYKSTDGGGTWSGKAAHSGVIIVKRDQPQVVRVIDVERDPWSGESGLWESRDGGETWNRNPPAGWETGWQNQSWALGKNRYGLAKTVGLDLSNSDAIYWADAQFVFGSFDGGRTFANLYTREVTPGWWRGRGIDNTAPVTLAIGEADSKRVFAGWFDIGLWRSLDGGQSWQACNERAHTGAWKGYGGNSACIVLDPHRPDVVWATMGERADLSTLVRSNGAGAPGSWSSSAAGVPIGFLNGLSLDRTSPTAQRRLFLTADGDVYRSVDDGTSWSKVFACGTCRTTAADPREGAVVYSGGEGGLWRSTSGGNPGSWTKVGPSEMSGRSNPPPRNFQWEGVHQIVPDPNRSGRVYVTVYGIGRGLYRSDDHGEKWRKVREGTHTRCVAIDPRNPDVLYLTSSPAFKAGGKAAGSQGILRSADGGRTWSSLDDGLSWPFGGPVAVDPADPTRVFLGSPGSGFLMRRLSAAGTGTTGSSR